jgi:phosphoribosylamine--glycine ligase
MKVLLLGGGGREHTLAWALHKSPRISSIYCAPGNAGIGEIATLYDMDPTQGEEVLSLAKEIDPDFVVIGPEGPLVSGVADLLRSSGFPVFGPGGEGARMEGSKAFSKSFMARHGIPTAPFNICTTMEQARKALEKRTPPYVVKADGLAAGKGAFLLDSLEEAEKTCEYLLELQGLGEAGKTVVIEDFLPGWEVSILALTDGKTVHLLPPSQDHKRAFDGDKGPNTGGMGAYTPVPQLSESMLEQIREKIILPSVEGLQKDGIPFCGVLYGGIMISQGKPYVLEFNVRFGDPEAQVVIPALDVDWGHVLHACATQTLEEVSWPSRSDAVAGVVLASGGYPGAYEKGKILTGLEEAEASEGILLFHGGTALDNEGHVITHGGRVCTVTGRGESLAEAVHRAYTGVKMIDFEKKQYRKDIGHRGLQHHPRVGVVLGSASDLSKAEEALKVFTQLRVPYEITVASAHRTPQEAAGYAAKAESRGIQVILAFAGLSAALPGVLAAHTLLPVFGVPVDAGTLGGMDALLAVAQMPPGVPVGSLGINGGRNAALLACRVLAQKDEELREQLVQYTKDAAEKVVTSRERLGAHPQPPSEAFLD